MRIILIGNYLPDRQESMDRFARMMQLGFEHAGILSEVWRPTVFFGKWSQLAPKGLGKWLGYLDKWILFPIVLKWRLSSRALHISSIRFHVCDHSNAPYLKHLPKDCTGITCHDVLAIRGAMGYADAYCPATRMGKIYQRWIVNNLIRAKKLVSVSNLTLSQLNEFSLDQPGEGRKWRVIHNAFNNTFYQMSPGERGKVLQITGIGLKPFILFVGSGLARKNRKLLIDMIVALGDQWNGNVCYAGQEADSELMEYANSQGFKGRVISVVKPDHHTLVALYSACEAFIFPSFSEGFGWPVIEAQACGAPVIASSLDPMPEVSGGAALHADPYQPQAFADAFLRLQDKEVRADLIERGFANCNRFKSEQMIEGYIDLYNIKEDYSLPV